MLLEAEDQASAEALIRQEPMERSGSVDWSLYQWVGVVGGLAVG